MKIEQQLIDCGLETKEASVYVALLELGEATVGRIAKKSKIKRTTLYDVLRLLKTRGLVSTSRSGSRTLFVAEHPRAVGERLDEQKQKFATALPELLALANAIDRKPKIRYFEGKEGVKEVYRDTLNYPRSELLAFVAEEAVEQFDEEFLNTVYLPNRIKKKIWVRALAPDLPYMRAYRGLDTASLRTTRLIDPKRFPIDVEINLYGGTKIGVMSFHDELGLIIESGPIARTLRSIFELCWDAAERGSTKDDVRGDGVESV